MREDRKIPKKSPKLSPNIRKLIAIESLREPRVPREPLAADLAAKIAALGSEKPPTEETLKKMISGFRAKADLGPTHWNLGQSQKYGILPEATPHILAVMRVREAAGVDPKLPVQFAIWVGLLCTVVAEPVALHSIANAYWLHGLMDALTQPDDAPDEMPDTTELDEMLIREDFEGIRSKGIEIYRALFPDDKATDALLRTRAIEYKERQNGGAK